MKDLVAQMPPTEEHPEGQTLCGPDAYVALVRQLVVARSNDMEMPAETVERLRAHLQAYAKMVLAPPEIPFMRMKAQVVAMRFDIASRVCLDLDRIFKDSACRARSVQLAAANDVRFRIASTLAYLGGLLEEWEDGLKSDDGTMPMAERCTKPDVMSDFVEPDRVFAWREGGVIGCGRCSQHLISMENYSALTPEERAKPVICGYCRAYNSLKDVG